MTALRSAVNSLATRPRSGAVAERLPARWPGAGFVGGVGVLSVMLISFSDRRYEIGLRKAIGADDGQILVQFLLEAVVLAAIGASIGTLAGSALCRALSDKFPWGLLVNPYGLAAAWGIALILAVGFGLYPAIRAARLSPMEAMR